MKIIEFNMLINQLYFIFNYNIKIVVRPLHHRIQQNSSFMEVLAGHVDWPAADLFGPVFPSAEFT